MSLPSKDEIRRFAIGKKATEQIVKMGSHTPITPEPEEMELKEAQLDIMRADKEALAEQEKYLQDMANEMKLKVIPIQELKLLKRETGYDWTNGWTKHEKREKPKPKPESIDEKVVYQYSGDPFPITRAELDQMKGSRALGRQWTKFNRNVENELQRVSLRKPLDIGSAIRGAPKTFRKQDNHLWEMIGLKPNRKPKQRHIQRTSKTMRVLRKRVKDGQKVFSFPDRIWKVKR